MCFCVYVRMYTYACMCAQHFFCAGFEVLAKRSLRFDHEMTTVHVHVNVNKQCSPTDAHAGPHMRMHNQSDGEDMNDSNSIAKSNRDFEFDGAAAGPSVDSDPRRR